MQHHIEYDSDAKILIGTTSGTSTVEGFRKYLDAIAHHPNLPNCVGFISDHRELGLGLTADQIDAVVGQASNHADRWRDMKHPMVVSNTAQYGMGRMYQMSGDASLGLRIHVCYTLEEARAWITNDET